MRRWQRDSRVRRTDRGRGGGKAEFRLLFEVLFTCNRFNFFDGRKCDGRMLTLPPIQIDPVRPPLSTAYVACFALPPRSLICSSDWTRSIEQKKENQFLQNPKWLRDSFVARAKTAVYLPEKNAFDSVAFFNQYG